MQDVGDEIIDVSIAVGISALAAVFVALLGVIVGGLLLRLGLTTDEGAAWSGISFGLPIGLAFAILALIYTFRKVRHYGEPK